MRKREWLSKKKIIRVIPTVKVGSVFKCFREFEAKFWDSESDVAKIHKLDRIVIISEHKLKELVVATLAQWDEEENIYDVFRIIKIEKEDILNHFKAEVE